MAKKIQANIAIKADGKGAIGAVNKITDAVGKSSRSVDSFKKKLSAINVAAKITAVASAMSIVGGVIGGFRNAIGAVNGAVDGFASKADGIAKFSRNVGMSAVDLQKWRYAAERSGISTDNFDKSLRKFSVNVSKAVNGEKKQLDLFNALGVSLRKSNGEMKSNNDLMLEVADAYKKIGNAQDRLRISEELFGKGGVGFGTLFEGGSAGVQSLLDRRARIGGMITEDDAKAAENFKDLLLDVDKVKEAIENKALSHLMPSLSQGFEDFLDWWDVNGEKVLADVKTAVDVVIYSVQDLMKWGEKAVSVFKNLDLVWDGLKITFKDFASSIGGFFTENVLDPIADFFKKTIPGLVSSLKTSVMSAVANLTETLSGIPIIGDKFAGISQGLRQSIAASQTSSPSGVSAVSNYTETRSTQTNRLDVNINGLNKDSSVTPAPGFNFGVIDFTAGYAF